MGRVGRLGGLTGPGSGCRATARRDFRLRLRVQAAEHAIGRTRVALEVDAARSMTASTSGLGDRHQRCHPLRAGVAAMTERDLSQHDQRTQSAFRQIVGRGNSRVVEKHEPLAGMPEQSGLQCDDLLVSHLARFQSCEFFAQLGLLGRLIFGVEFVGRAQSM
jgi:hypothetical protein